MLLFSLTLRFIPRYGNVGYMLLSNETSLEGSEQGGSGKGSLLLKIINSR